MQPLALAFSCRASRSVLGTMRGQPHGARHLESCPWHWVAVGVGSLLLKGWLGRATLA